MSQKPSKVDLIEAFATLGNFFLDVVNQKKNIHSGKLNQLFLKKFEESIILGESKNKWFTKLQVHAALLSWGNALQKDKIEQWVGQYPLSKKEPKRVGVMMAGNIPLVGFHDFISVLMSGNKIYAKPSSQDDLLLPIIKEILCFLLPELSNYIFLSQQFIKDMDAYIGTGSNNSTRYFEYYFKGKPFIIRGNRNSAAIINGNESPADFNLLGKDIFQYYGLGCRNVSKLFVPEGYKFDSFFEGVYEYNTVMDNNKYVNNYEYNRAVYLLNSIPLFDNNFLLLKQDSQLASPVSVLFFEFYKNDHDLKILIENNKEKLQCIVSANGQYNNSLCFGESQMPDLVDYADNVDTMQFLSNI